MGALCNEEILIVDDDLSLLKLLGEHLESFGCLVTTCDNGHDALQMLQGNAYTLVITDLHMPGMTGLELLERVKQEAFAAEVMVVTADDDKNILADIIVAGAYDYLTKPFSLVELEAKLRRFKREKAMLAELEEKRQLEDMLFQSQKVEAIGTLASGIAHDFNNILSAVNGFSELGLLLDGVQGTEAADYFVEIQKAGHRATKLIQQILAFSRHSDDDFSPVQLVSTIKEVLKLLRASIPTSIEIRQQIDSRCEDIMVMANQTMIHQVIMNLCTNAYHSMKKRGGILEISLGQKDLNTAQTEEMYLALRSGSYLLLEIRDTGPGIEKEILSRIFEPYFTTKERDEGTGLGLAVVDGIVKKHGGAIRVTSSVGVGTTFQVYLPITVGEHGVDRGRTVMSIPSGSEHILFVDDEESILSLNQKAFTSLGYQVSIAASGVEALRLTERNPDRFDLVVTDMAMPTMNGVELTMKLLNIRPELPVIICTGFSEMVNESLARQIGARGFLMKPVSVAELATMARHVLDSTDGAEH